MKKIYLIGLILISSFNLYAQEENKMKDQDERLKDSSIINKDTISYNQKSDIGLNFIIGESESPTFMFTFRKYFYNFLSLELGL